MWELIQKGGIVMYPILLCSVLTLAIFLEKLWSLREGRVIPENFVKEIEEFIRVGKNNEAIALCSASKSSIGRIIYSGLKRLGKPVEILKEAISDQGRQEAILLEKYLTTLGTIAGVSPLLGLLGTVTGMIKTFNVLAVSKKLGDPGLLSSGISEALITTAAGLIVAIPSFILYKYFSSKVDKLVIKMEGISLKFIEILRSKDGI
jgi:biopolymer transport protein ExbB